MAGALTVTAALVAAVYAIVNGNEAGWTSGQTLGLLAAAVVLMGAFLVIETRAKHPLMPLSIFRHRTLAAANVMGVLMAAGLFAAFFLSALYMQLVLDYTPLEVGFAYLPQTLVWGGVSLFLSDKLVMRYGIRMPIVIGFPAFALGILLFARAPVDGNYFVDMLPAMLLQGFGAGVAFNPLLLAAMGDVEPQDSGLASGVVNTAFMMGGALGLAILASAADSRTDSLVASGENAIDALLSGYHLAFLIGAVFAAGAAVGGSGVPASGSGAGDARRSGRRGGLNSGIEEARRPGALRPYRGQVARDRRTGRLPHRPTQPRSSELQLPAEADRAPARLLALVEAVRVGARLARVELEMRGAALPTPVLGRVEQRLAVPRRPVVGVHREVLDPRALPEPHGLDVEVRPCRCRPTAPSASATKTSTRAPATAARRPLGARRPGSHCGGCGAGRREQPVVGRRRAPPTSSARAGADHPPAMAGRITSVSDSPTPVSSPSSTRTSSSLR